MLPIFHRLKVLFVVLVLFLGLLVMCQSSVFAQDTLLGWQFDPQVTEIGKNAERARQLVYWLFTHSPSYSVPVFVSIWSISRNIVFVMFILVIAFTGLAYIISKRSGAIGPVFSGISSPIFGISVPTLFFRIGVLLLYVVFSYLIVIGLVQSGEIFSRFFAERYFGCDLFNIRFTGGGTNCQFTPDSLREMESNYTDFVGYRDPNILNQESANTSLFLVRLTSLTYNLFAIVLILRQVILWFLLMASPFLAILMPFVFIRNTGWIWIGVFFQWLFYGPLVSLFLAGLVLIWQNGIPYPFDFSRVNQTNGQVFPTSINILYGGPGQLLSPTNSANYVDTYAEYIVALVMLWVCIFLPWLLLRIFRDYCCDILRQNQAVLLSILDKVRGLGPQPPPPTPGLGPLGSTQTAMQLPFRKSTEDFKSTSIERLREVSRVNTSELTRSLSLSISTLSEVARYEMNKQTQSNTITTLNKIANPYTISRSEDRDQFVQIKKELEERAHQGDRLAQQVISAALRRPGHVTPVPLSPDIPEITEHEAYNNLTKVSTLTQEKVRDVIREFHSATQEKTIETISEKLAVPQIKVQQVVSALPSYAPKGTDAIQTLAENPTMAGDIAKKSGVSEEKVREIIKHFSQATLSQKERLEMVSHQVDLAPEIVRALLEEIVLVQKSSQQNIASLPASAVIDRVLSETPEVVNETLSNQQTVEQIAKTAAVPVEKVRSVVEAVSQLSQVTLTEKEKVEAVSRQVDLPDEKVRALLEEIVQALQKSHVENVLGGKPEILKGVVTDKQAVEQVAKKTAVSVEKVMSVVDTISQLSRVSLTKEERLERVSRQVDLPAEKVKGVLEEMMHVAQSSVTVEKLINETPQVLRGATEQMIGAVSQKTDVSPEKVRSVMRAVSQLEPHRERMEENIDQVSKKSDLPKEKVRGVIANFAAARLERTDEGKPKIAHKATVSVEDYEEVKNMWTNHYKLTEVPVSDDIKSREDWLNEDVRVLTNTLNMVTSLSPADKEKGMKQVASILPFLLLGGFSELETVVYLKAKLAAAKQVLEQLSEREKIKEEVLSEEEETLLEVPRKEKAEEQKAMHLEEEAVIKDALAPEQGTQTVEKDKPDESTK